MAKRINHNATKAQVKAFEKAVKALDKCKELGLKLYGKQFDLIAFTSQADEYVHETGLEACMAYTCGEIPHLSASALSTHHSNFLSDSGADDGVYYQSEEVEKRFNP
jgi:hypothetical protein